MNNSIFLFLSQYRIFWRLQWFVGRTLFWIRVLTFGAKSAIRGASNKSNTFLYLLWITGAQIFLAIIFAIILLIVDPHTHKFFYRFGLEITNDDGYVTFLATISGIGGVFIGLYYAAISSIGSSIYARVPNNIRDLLAQDRFGNFYMLFLAFLTFLGLILISMRVIGFDRIYLTVPIMVLFSGIGIISFVQLGRRAFNLFEPTALSSHLFVQLVHWIKNVKVGGFRWRDGDFQYNAYKHASLCMDTLHTLSDITSKETHLNGKPFLILCKRTIQFLIFYEETKKYIPSGSHWYEKKYEHRDWYKTSDSQISIAHQTGTALQPEVTNNKEWIEDKAIPILKNYLEINLREERYAEILNFTEYLNLYLETLARNGKVGRALDILENLGEVILDIISHESKEELITSEVLEKLAIIEKFSVMPTAIALACRKYVEALDADNIEKKLSKITWKKDSELYKHGFLSYCLPQLEWLKSKMSFEISTEGYLVSPTWYQRELLVQVETKIFTENINFLISKGQRLYSSWIKRTNDTNHPWLTGALMSSEWEFWHKVDDQMEIWQTKWGELNRNRKIKGLPWAEFDGEKLAKVSRNRQAELVQSMSKQNVILAFSKKPKDFPDYAGQFLHTAGEKSFEALLTNNKKLLEGIFKSYFAGCMLRFGELNPKSTLPDWHIQQNFKLAVAPLMDLIDISGYARLLADYHDNDRLWQLVMDTWSIYFADHPDKLPFFAAAIALTTGAFEISHRSILRTNWKLQINKRLSDVFRHQVDPRGYENPDTIIKHHSALIRIFTKNQYGSTYDGIDIFVAFYLCSKKGSKELDFGWKWKHLKNSLEREQIRYQTQNNNEVSE